MVYVLFIVIALVSFAVQRTLQSKFEAKLTNGTRAERKFRKE